MIETLGSVVASLDQEDPVIPDLEIHGITFQDGDLSKPLYPSLIDHARAPEGVQFEPGVQIRSGQRDLTFLFRIDPKPEVKVEFERDAADLPVIESMDSLPGTGIAGVVARSLPDSKSAQLTWRQSEARSEVTALRLRCRHTPPQIPSDPELVDGGVYLVIVNRPMVHGEELAGGDPGPLEPDTITILGTDSGGRPIYDLYHREALTDMSSDLSFEPTFRVREGEKVDLSMRFAPDVDLRFLPAPGNHQEVAVEGYQPPGWPPQVRGAARDDLGKRCRLQWVQDLGRSLCTTSNMEVNQQGYCRSGHVTSFLLTAFIGEEVMHFWQVAEKDKRRLIDPTVIQPPNCTSSGICIKP